MALISLANSTILSDYGKPYIVAELNTSHFGCLDTAKMMIDKAKQAGCDAVKFQSWSTQSLYSQTYYDQNPIAKRFITKFSFSENDLKEAVEYCDEVGIGFSSTPYSTEEVDFLVNHCNVPFIKVASMDLNNTGFLEYIGNTGVPVVLSTGMGTIDEIESAVRTIEKTGNTNICILHCVSIYPPETRTLNLNNIIGLRQRLPDYPIGYSDHSIGTEMASASIALGACLIEKHFTLDNSKIGMDNQMAAEPESMALLVSQCHNVFHALGSHSRNVSEAELEQRNEMRRSVVASRQLPAGKTLCIDDLALKRPGTGIPADQLSSLLGKKLLNDIAEDTLIHYSDLSEKE